MNRQVAAAFLIAFSLLAAPALASAGDAVVPGRVVVEPPTCICLGFQWYIEGDENRNAEVAVFYRRAGDLPWSRALPLLRIGGEEITIPRAGSPTYVTPHMFAGSILDLEPDTKYECRFIMTDLDGLDGDGERLVTVRTRAEPRPCEGGRVFHVYPPGHKGEKEEPAFNNLMQAYYGITSAYGLRDGVKPGDTILIHAGLYQSRRFLYGDPMGVGFSGTCFLTTSGTAEKPIVIRAAGDGEVIFDGAGAHMLFDVSAADYNYFEGITIRNTDIAFYAGKRDIIGSSGLVVKNCRLENIGIGVEGTHPASRDFYIADNVFIGRGDPHRLHGWFDPGPYDPAPTVSPHAVMVYGQGHVICHNYIANFHDGIDIATFCFPTPDMMAVSIDIYNNDIFNVTDDFIEADGGVHNIRVLRNRGFNSAQCGLSAQPVQGGPAYFIRNVVYNVPWGVALKFKVFPAGLIVYNNTFIAEWLCEAPFSNAHMRNNLFLGTDAPGKPLLFVRTATSYTTSDYNGYRPNRTDGPQFVLGAPPPGVQREYVRARLLQRECLTLAEFTEATGWEQNSVVVDYDIFENVPMPDHTQPRRIYRIDSIDFRIRPGSAAIDAGVFIPNVTEGFSGNAPDLGAYETGAAPVVYGPRTGAGPTL